MPFPNRIVIIGGGQSGLAAARVFRDDRRQPVVLEAGESPAGSWGGYYDSLTLFSPARYSNFPGYPFPAEPDHYPRRDEVVGYLRSYADWLGVPVHTGKRVIDVSLDADAGYLVHTAGGEIHRADGIVAATGSFANPYWPTIPGADRYAGDLLHAADYRDPVPFDRQRVVVVGGGNSAVQIAYELAQVADVTLAVRRPLRFEPQIRGGKDAHFWLRILGLDLLPPAVLARLFKERLVADNGVYRRALDAGVMNQRQMFTRFTRDGVTWPDGSSESVDTVVLATGYRPNLPYLQRLGALAPDGGPLHDRGISTTHTGLAYLGLEFQRSFSSNTLRGVHRDARYIADRLRQDRVRLDGVAAAGLVSHRGPRPAPNR